MIGSLSRFFRNRRIKPKRSHNKKNKDYQIVKLELTGKCVTLDASYVLRQNISLNKKREQAKSYWNGEVKDDEKEVLFEGIAVVKEIICSNK